MQPFEYLSVLVSIIVGLGLSHLLTTAARLIQERERVSIYPPTIIWMGILFVLHIQIWWAAFEWQDERVWSFLAFLLFLSLPISAYLLGVLLVPDLDRAGPVDLKANYFSNRVAFYSILTILPIASLLHEALHGGNIHWDLDAAFRIGFSLVAVFGLLYDQRGLHWGVTAVFTMAFLSYVGLLFTRLP